MPQETRPIRTAGPLASSPGPVPPRGSAALSRHRQARSPQSPRHRAANRAAAERLMPALDHPPAPVAPSPGNARRTLTYAVLIRVLITAGFLAIWFWTQSLIGARPLSAAGIEDRLHSLTAVLNAYLLQNPRAASALLMLSSFFIDLLGVFLLARWIFGPSVRPFLGLVLLMLLRQFIQALVVLHLLRRQRFLFLRTYRHCRFWGHRTRASQTPTAHRGCRADCRVPNRRRHRSSRSLHDGRRHRHPCRALCRAIRLPPRHSARPPPRAPFVALPASRPGRHDRARLTLAPPRCYLLRPARRHAP